MLLAVAFVLCCSSSVAGVFMMKGKKDSPSLPPSSPSPPPPPPPAPEKYRYVRIYRDKDGDDHWMNLAEVEVFSGGVNIAASKTVTGHSLYEPQFPHAHLVDGNKNNFAHTNNDQVEWFLIDLGEEYEIEKVVITNRVDCCQARARNTKIQLSKTSDMSSPKESNVITAADAQKATFTWTVSTNTLVAA